MSDRQHPLAQLFQSLSERPFIFVRPGGNWGDHLIYFGAEQLATRLGLTWRSVDYETFSTTSARAGEVIYLHGGGGFNPFTSGKAMRCLKAAVHTPGVLVIQGPCTISSPQVLQDLHGDFWSMRAEKLVFFTRERRSAAICRENLPDHIQSYLNEDTAFYLSAEVLLEKAGKVKQNLHLLAVRQDNEAVPSDGGSRPWDATIDPAQFALTFDHWIRIHAAAKTIVTNRTHSAICGAILGTPVTMFDGAYHKNRSIWEFSLKQRNVEWLSNSTAVPKGSEVDPLLSWMPVAAVRQSWKLDRFAKRLKGVPLN